MDEPAYDLIIQHQLGPHGGYYVEGNSPRMAYLDRAQGLPRGSTFFEFETDTFAEAAMHLQALGFTATQILECIVTQERR